jgi:kumamolisin
VAYILDKDLIRFVKFALAVLASIITAAAIFGGLDIQHEVEKVQDGIDKVRAAEDKARDSRDAIEKMVKDVQKTADQIEQSRQRISENEKKIQELRDDSQRLRDDAKSFVELINKNRPMVLALLHLSATETTVIAGTAIPAQTDRPWFTARELARLYDLPNDLNGKGQTIGLVELGGGYIDADLDSYFAKLGIPKPQITWVSVDGTKNQPDNSPNSADGQVTLDIEVAGAVANGATIKVYFAQDIAAAVKKATADRVTVISISWGSPESNWGRQAVNRTDEELKDAAMQGVTTLCASGDSGAGDGIDDGEPHADFPASSPWVLAVGGTELKTSAGGIASEVVWNDGSSATGGGVSNILPMPPWQSGVAVPTRKDGQKGRGFPDVAANASPATGYYVILHGKQSILGGTSAATPFWAGLIALLNQGLGRKMGYVNPVIYTTIGPTDAFHKITEGNNGSPHGLKGYSGGPGWSPAAGWGSPSGRNLLNALRSHS